MSDQLNERLKSHLLRLQEKGLAHRLSTLEGPQGPRVRMDGREILMLSSNDYLGLASHPKVVEAARGALERYGQGTASVRLIAGNLDLHRRLEEELADFLGFEDCVVEASGSDAHQGLIPAALGEEDAVFSDELNHASVIDAIRLSRAHRRIWAHGNVDALEKSLREESGARLRLVITDGVFCMEGHTARLAEIAELTASYGAVLAVHDAHGVGVLGSGGRGTPEHFGINVDIQTGDFGMALGGGGGGFVAADGEVADFLRQRSRPYMFSTSLSPAGAAGALAALRIVRSEPELRERLWKNSRYFRSQMASQGFEVMPGELPIVPIIVKEASPAHDMRSELLEEGVFVCGFAYPVVPKGAARLRVQISAAHSEEDLDFAVEAFGKVARRVGTVG